MIVMSSIPKLLTIKGLWRSFYSFLRIIDPRTVEIWKSEWRLIKEPPVMMAFRSLFHIPVSPFDGEVKWGQNCAGEDRIRIYRWGKDDRKKAKPACDRTSSVFFPETLIENSGMADCRAYYFLALWSGLSLIGYPVPGQFSPVCHS